MAYFSNSDDGFLFDTQCLSCKYGEQPCPIFLAQTTHNYEAVGNETATAILDLLVKQDGTCTMLKLAKKDLWLNPNQTKLDLNG